GTWAVRQTEVERDTDQPNVDPRQVVDPRRPHERRDTDVASDRARVDRQFEPVGSHAPVPFLATVTVDIWRRVWLALGTPGSRYSRLETSRSMLLLAAVPSRRLAAIAAPRRPPSGGCVAR